jgi:hypothetical protein
MGSHKVTKGRKRTRRVSGRKARRPLLLLSDEERLGRRSRAQLGGDRRLNLDKEEATLHAPFANERDDESAAKWGRRAGLAYATGVAERRLNGGAPGEARDPEIDFADRSYREWRARRTTAKASGDAVGTPVRCLSGTRPLPSDVVSKIFSFMRPSTTDFEEIAQEACRTHANFARLSAHSRRLLPAWFAYDFDRARRSSALLREALREHGGPASAFVKGYAAGVAIASGFIAEVMDPLFAVSRKNGRCVPPAERHRIATRYFARSITAARTAAPVLCHSNV